MTRLQRMTSIRSATHQRWETTRDGLRLRRQSRADRRHLVAELATYTTRAEVDDLLATMHNRNEAVDAEIRTVVLSNLQANHRLVGIAA